MLAASFHGTAQKTPEMVFEEEEHDAIPLISAHSACQPLFCACALLLLPARACACACAWSAENRKRKKKRKGRAPYQGNAKSQVR